MALHYTVRVTDRLLRFDTTHDDIIVTLLPFIQTPNAPYEIHRISTGDGHTVTVRVDPSTTDFLLPDGSVAITLDDTDHTVYIKIPAQGLSPAYVASGTGGGGGTGPGGEPAPDVTIDASAPDKPNPEIIFRSDHRVEVNVAWTPAASATSANFMGAAVYLEDPDISSGANPALGAGTDPGVPLDGSSQTSGKWAPVYVNNSTKSPAQVFLDTTMGSQAGQSYKSPRDVRIYLAAYGPYSQPKLHRATDATPTPNIVATIPDHPDGKSGMEYAFLVSNPQVTVTPDYHRPDPNYYLTFTYDPPDPATPVPPGMNHFGGVRIVFAAEDKDGNPVLPGTDTGIDVPVDQAEAGYKSPLYTPGPAGKKFWCYFCSEDDSQPLGKHINTLIDGVTPRAEAIVPALHGAPDVTNFAISGQQILNLLDGSIVAEATFSWTLPDPTTGANYAGNSLYLVNVTGSNPPFTKFPQVLAGEQGNLDTSVLVDWAKVPRYTETWTVACISIDSTGALADDPKKFGMPSFHSPTVTWDVGPPQPGDKGSGVEYAPLVTVGAGAAATATQTLSADGVGMVTFNVGPWINPDDNKFGAVQVAMVVNHDTTKPTMWTVPKNATTFTTPSMPSFGNFDATVPVEFFLVSDDPQGNKNTLVPGTTPKIGSTFLPVEGKIIPAREGWFDPTQFDWVGDQFTAESFSAKIIQVGKTLVVGGAPTSFGGSDNGQIAVKNAQGVLRAWMGEQQPGQGSGAPLWGAWFGQLWVGGTSPLDAPLWIDNQGIIEVGGIAAASSTFPYISIRDDRGYEKGRIGAKLTVNSGTAVDGVGPNPPLQLTSGAWFTQLAVGGSSLTNWNVLIVPDPNNPLGSQFQMRNINLLEIDYAARQGTPANEEFKLQFGNNVWAAPSAGGSGYQWQFPGIRIHQIDNQTDDFGITLLSRGLVLRGTYDQVYQSARYPVLCSLVTYNGDPSGSYQSNKFFWAELNMYAPKSPFTRTVALVSGSAARPDPSFMLRDNSNSLLFNVNENGDTVVGGVLQGRPGTPSGTTMPVVAYALSIAGYNSGAKVIDSDGKWVGPPITAGGGQSPWTQNIDGAGYSLSSVGNITARQYFISGISDVMINSSGQFVGHGVQVAYGIGCTYLNTSQGQIDVGPVNAAGAITAVGNIFTYASFTGGAFKGSGVDTTGTVNAGQGYTGGSFRGAGVAVGSYGIGCGYLSTAGGTIDTGSLNASGNINITQELRINGYLVTSSAKNAIWVGHGVQCNDAIYGCVFGIYGISVGWPQNADHPGGAYPIGQVDSFMTGDGRRAYVCGGLIIRVV